MRSGGIATVAAISLFLAASKSFVDPAPLSSQERKLGSVHEDSDVEQLQTLKHSIGNTVAAVREAQAAESRSSTIKESSIPELNTDASAAIEETHEKEAKDASPETPSVATAIPRPLPPSLVPKGQAEVVHGEHQRQNTSAPAESSSTASLTEQLTENGQRRAYAPQDLSNSLERMDKLATYASVQYSPMDMAEYVFWTGDEKGVTLAVEEFLQEGLMTRDEAIAFLQEVKYNLDNLQPRYAQAKERTNLMQKIPLFEKSEQSLPLNKEYQDVLMDPLKKRPMLLDPLAELSNNNILGQNRQDSLTNRNVPEVAAPFRPKDAVYEELLERLKVADFLYTKYSLEEVIYQLAKVMFSQALTRGSNYAQDILQKFTVFLETEAAEGRITRTLEKKVLGPLTG
ncbi:uncharacterized protein LOC107271631 isoform X2 [Cephus cinctus]|uniref:Uncharacterized protein LOC107271631 isoform X2 n=1 Tax=Cephus cinctus TaxID=211228 RepID=A0AAJ7RQA2_CEPCN|nr:uncharacterized protein LOC107271631 isoform X2 [Cephus cinctus]